MEKDDQEKRPPKDSQTFRQRFVDAFGKRFTGRSKSRPARLSEEVKIEKAPKKKLKLFSRKTSAEATSMKIDTPSDGSTTVPASKMGEESNGMLTYPATFLVHFQKDRARPPRNHKIRHTIAPQDDSTFMNEGLDWFFSGKNATIESNNDKQRFSNVTANDISKQQIMKPKLATVDESSVTEETVVVKTALLPLATAKNGLQHRRIVEPIVDHSLQKDLSPTSPQLHVSSAQFTFKQVVNEDRKSSSSSSRPGSTEIRKTSQQNVAEVSTDENANSVHKILQKSYTISSERPMRWRPRSMFEVTSKPEQVVAAVARPETSSSIDELVSMRKKAASTSTAEADGDEKRKSVLEMRAHFENSKLRHSSMFAIGAKANEPRGPPWSKEQKLKF